MVRLPSVSLPFCLFVPLTPDCSSLPTFRNVPRHVPHLNQDTPVRERAFHFRLIRRPREHSIFNLYLLAPSCSSKGPLLRSLEQMFLFGITAIIFVLSTIVIVLGPGLTSQAILIMIEKMDPSFDKLWSPHKIHIVSVIITVVTRLNARFSPSFIWSLVVE
jgi:hypothetical protein